jgi:hypothetical protein
MIQKAIMILFAMALGMAAIAAVPSSATQRSTNHIVCVRDIKVNRYVGYTVASWTQKCAHSAQVFAEWDGAERWGAKSTGVASTVNEPSGIVLKKADCAGYNTFNSAGDETTHKVTYGSGC